MRALVTGATGFIGGALLPLIEKPVVLSRDANRARHALNQYDATVFAWDPMAGAPPQEAFDGVDAVFHLAGESVASGRWSKKRKQAIRDSREIGTRNLVAGLRQLANRPPVLVSSSAVGYYGSRGDEILDEVAGPGDDFLADVCVAWEREAMRGTELGMRVVCLRTGVVLGRGGALRKMLTPFKLGLGGRLGNGRQWMPWIHVADLAALFIFAAQQSLVSGPMNGAAPQPVTNAEFTKALAATLHRPALLPTPYFALRLALGEFAKVLFDSQRAVPNVAQDNGFQFRHPEIQGALADILSK